MDGSSGVSSSAVEVCAVVAAYGLSVVVAAAIVSVLAATIVAVAGVCVVAVSLVVIGGGAIRGSSIGEWNSSSSSLSSVLVLSSDKASNLTRNSPVSVSRIPRIGLPPSWITGLTLGSSSITSDIGVANEVVRILVTRCANYSAIISSRAFFYSGNLPW